MVRKRHVLSVAVLLMAASASAQAQVNFMGVDFWTNGTGPGSVAMDPDGVRLRMSDGEYLTARSALSINTFNLSGPWTTSYRMTFSCDGVGLHPEKSELECPGDGIGFVVTDGDQFQLGAGGLELGYEGSFSNSVAFGFKTFWDHVTFGENGLWEARCCSPHMNLTNNFEDDFDVVLSYDGSFLSATVTQVGTGSQIFTGSYAWIAPAWAANARVGFVSASGDAAEYSWVSDWTLRQSTVPEPASVLLFGGGAALLALIGMRRRV